MIMSGCDVYTATTAKTTSTTVSILFLGLLVDWIVTTVKLITLFARSFILGNVTYFKYLYYL